jgi:signal transduction histidine kinase
MTIGKLRWLTIAAPVAFVSVLYVLLHTVLEELHDFPGVMLTAVWAAASVSFFSFAVFRLVDRLEQRIVDQNRDLATLLEVGHGVSTSGDFGEALSRTADIVRDVAEADVVEVWLLRDHSLELAVRTGESDGGSSERDPSGETLARSALATSEALVLRAGPDDPRLVELGLDPSRIGMCCAVPLVHAGSVLGAMYVTTPSAGRIACSMELLDGIADRIALGVANAQLHEHLLGEAVVEERVRIARELHDGLAQVIGYANTQTLAVRHLVQAGRTDAATRELDAMGEALRGVYTDIREAIVGLRLATDGPAGLCPSVASYLESFEHMTGIATSFEDDGAADLRVPQVVEIQVIRIVQEALTNVRKHARASRVVVRLTASDGDLVLEVEDDGVGLAEGNGTPTGWPRLGLRTMGERAAAVGGSFTITSTGGGTAVTVSVPVAVEVPIARSAR